MMDRTAGLNTGLHNNETPQIIWNQKAAPQKKVLTYREHDRMGGSIPVWEKPNSAKDKVTENFAHILTESNKENSFKTALARVDDAPIDNPQRDQEFGFGDVVDMVNPLQHIPGVGHAYRKITGDEIKPVSRIMGGALFGGPLGAASGLVNAVAVQETGNDFAGHALSSLSGTMKNSSFSASPAQKPHIVRLTENIDQGIAREPITQISMREMPRIERLP